MDVRKNIILGGLEPHICFVLSKRKIKELEKKLEELKKRWPAHSVPPSMWMELERLEEELARAREEEREKNG